MKEGLAGGLQLCRCRRSLWQEAEVDKVDSFWRERRKDLRSLTLRRRKGADSPAPTNSLMWWRLTSAVTVSSRAAPDQPFMSPSRGCGDGGCRLCFLGVNGDSCNKWPFLCVDGDKFRLPFRGLEGDSCELDLLEMMGDKWKLAFLDMEGDMSSEDLDPLRSCKPREE